MSELRGAIGTTSKKTKKSKMNNKRSKLPTPGFDLTKNPGVEQANASLCRAVWFFALFAGGTAPVFAAAVSIMASSWFLCGLGGICPAVAQRLFWIFGVGTFGVAYGVHAVLRHLGGSRNRYA
ncbi:unnamed protein product [Symbiodinium sp. CCMP2592]|nr:unnamed protein product [Symbiodinium sp. CCMP2592]